METQNPCLMNIIFSLDGLLIKKKEKERNQNQRKPDLESKTIRKQFVTV